MIQKKMDQNLMKNRLHSVEGDDEDGEGVDATRMLQRKIEAFRLAGRQTYTFVMGQRAAVSV